MRCSGKYIIFLLFLFAATSSLASHKIKVLALFTNKAMLVIDGNRQILSRGQTSKEGIKLISSTSEYVVLEHHGKEQKLKLGSEISASFKQRDKGAEVVIWADDYGMFRTHGSINNFTIKFLVDTGATSVALNENQAQRLGLNYKRGKVIRASTASGIAKAYSIRLQKVKVGTIQLNNVEAVIISGSFPTDVLLGQSFLSRMQMKRDGKKMILQKNF